MAKNKARAQPPRNKPRPDVRGLEAANPTAPFLTNGFSKFSLVSISSYYDAFYEQQANTDGSPLRLLEIDWHTDTQAISQDLRFVLDFSGSFQMIGGLYYGFEDTFMHNTYEIYQDLVDFRAAIAKPEIAGNAPFMLDFGAVDQQQATEKETFAAYVQTRWEITEDLSVDYAFNDDMMGYVAYSRGYRSGSFNGGVYYQVRPLESAYANPEYIEAYEVGFKTDLLENSLRINSAIFFSRTGPSISACRHHRLAPITSHPLDWHD